MIPSTVEFVFHGSLVECDGHIGVYYPSADSLHMCRLDKETALHELSHAWARESLSDDQRQQFVAFRNAESWNDPVQAWKFRPTEYAAEAMRWALMDRDITVPWVYENGETSRTLLRIPDSSPEELTDAYFRLTGLEPLYRSLDTIETSNGDSKPAGMLGA